MPLTRRCVRYVFEGKKRSLFEETNGVSRRSSSDMMNSTARLFAKHGYFRCAAAACPLDARHARHAIWWSLWHILCTERSLNQPLNP